MNLGFVIPFSILIIFVATTIGSSMVFFIKKGISIKVSNMILGFASGIMIAAGIFGLLIPSIEEAKENYGNFSIFPVIIGFLIGGAILYLLDKIIPHFHQSSDEEEGREAKNLSRQIKFFLAVTIHNIPEGLAVGFACGLAMMSKEDAAMWGALSLAIGIAIQNIPEGSAVSIPLLETNIKKTKAFAYGMFSGLVEPIFAIVGLFLATSMQMLMPWLLSFAAGAMIYVTIDELLPSARKGDYVHYGLWAFMIGFSIMLALELIL